MKGFSRTIRYFSLMAAEYIALTLLITAVCFLFRVLELGSTNGGEALFVTVLLILCVFIAIFSIGHYSVTTSLVLSYSVTRKHIFWGTQWMLLLIVSAILVLLGGCCALFTNLSVSGFFRLLPSLVGFYAAAIGLGALLGGIVLRFGKTAAAILSVSSAVLGGIVGFCSVMLFSDSGFPTVFMQFAKEGSLSLLLGGLVILLAGWTVNYSILRKAAAR